MGRRTLAPGDVSQLWGVRAAPLSPSQRGCHPGSPRGGGAGPWPGRWDGVGALPLWQLPRVGMNGAALPRALSVQAVPVPTSPAGTAHWAGGVTLAPVTRCSEATSPATAWVTLPGTETGTGAMGAAPSAVGTPGMAGHGDTVHSLQELRRSASLATKVFVQRDYSDGTTCQFQTKFPPELESRIERQLFEETVKTLNSFYAEAEKIGGSSYLEGCLACATAYFIFLCMETHYEKVLKKISKYIQEQNEKIYAPRGLLLTDPLERGMRVIEISIYEDRCSSGSSSSGSSSSSSGGGGGGAGGR
ncbi:golgin subfamily A member 7B isoform X1 [Anser cygnoides]